MFGIANYNIERFFVFFEDGDNLTKPYLTMVHV